MITSTFTLNIPPPLPPNPGFLGDPPCLAEFSFSPLRTELVKLLIRSPAVQAAFEAMVVTMPRLGLRQRIRFPLRTGTELLIFCLQELLFVCRYNKLMLGVANTATVHSHPKGLQIRSAGLVLSQRRTTFRVQKQRLVGAKN